MHITLIEPYYTGSHRAWADGYQHHSQHNIHLLPLPGQFWKWRMQGGAVTLARLYREAQPQPDIILATDMFNLATFRALTRDLTHDTPIALYFHENQLSYPQNRRQKHGWRYGFVNYISALAADALYFNSAFHMADFFAQIPRMLKHFADYNELETVDLLREKASVLPLGLDLQRFDAHHTNQSPDAPPRILWNHRWEADKNPQAFLQALGGLMTSGYDFEVILAGENFRQEPSEFIQAREQFGGRVLHYGYAESFAHYARLMWQADFIVSSAYQDFFGIAVTEGIYCGCIPILPRRLNYPALVPEAMHATCLYPEGKLQRLLEHHLTGKFQVDTTTLQAHVAPFDWSHMAGVYDETLARLAGAP